MYQLFLWVLIGSTFAILIWSLAVRLDITPYWPIIVFLPPLILSLVNVFVLHSYTPDEKEFFQLGWGVAESLQSGTIPPWDFRNVRVGVYSWVVGVVFSITGKHRIAILTVNSGFWGMSIVYWLRLTKDLYGRVPNILPLLFIFYPAGIVWAFQNVRDSLVFFIISITLWTFIQWIQKRNVRYLVLFGGQIILLLSLRTEIMLFILTAAILSETAAILQRDKQFIKYSGVAITLLGLSIAIIIDSTGEMFTYIDKISFEFIEGRRARRALVQHAYLSELKYSSWLDIILYLPIRIAYFLMSPFIVDPPEIGQLWKQYLDSIYITTILLSLILLSKSMLKDIKREHIFIILYAVIVLCGYSIIITESVVAYRRRLYAIPVLLIFVSVQFADKLSIKY